ncbi:hypothetical protein D3C73_1348870 [compost metagenome]
MQELDDRVLFPQGSQLLALGVGILQDGVRKLLRDAPVIAQVELHLYPSVRHPGDRPFQDRHFVQQGTGQVFGEDVGQKLTVDRPHHVPDQGPDVDI